MKISKEEKGFVIWWVDRQFASNPLFPDKCVVEDKNGKPGVSKDHVKAYKSWRKTPAKRSQVESWVDKWLNKRDRKALRRAMEQKAAEGES